MERGSKASTNSFCQGCNGKGTQSANFLGKELEIACIWCEGKWCSNNQAFKQAMEIWCQCGNPSGAVQLFESDYFQHPKRQKHHYRCIDCNKITQIG